ncbi:ubiquitin-like protein Pup, partial [Streptomyces sp. NPDC059506]
DAVLEETALYFVRSFVQKGGEKPDPVRPAPRPAGGQDG